MPKKLINLLHRIHTQIFNLGLLTPPPGHPHAANRIPQDIVTVNNESEINNFVSMFNNGGFNDDSDDDDL